MSPTPRKARAEQQQRKFRAAGCSDEHPGVSTPRKARKAPRLKAPSEHEEQKTLVELLTMAGIKHFSVPNGLRASRSQVAKAKAEGMQAGVPDLHIPEPAPGAPKGCVVEMKRRDGRPSDVKPEQFEWLRWYEDRGVRAVIGWGWESAVIQLRALGYRVARMSP